MRSRPLALLALLATVIAACSGGGGDDDDDGDTQGSLDLTIECVAGVTCGESGTLRIPVHESSCGGSPLITITDPAVTLSSSLDATASVDGLDAGEPYCIELFLDVDTSGGLSSGDAIATGGGQTLTPDPVEEFTFTLDAIEP